MNAEIQEMVLKSCSSGEIRQAAVRNGLRSLNEDGWRLVGRGVTTPEEVLRATKDQSMSNSAKEDEKAAAAEAAKDKPEKRDALVSV